MVSFPFTLLLAQDPAAELGTSSHLCFPGTEQAICTCHEHICWDWLKCRVGWYPLHCLKRSESDLSPCSMWSPLGPFIAPLVCNPPWKDAVEPHFVKLSWDSLFPFPTGYHSNNSSSNSDIMMLKLCLALEAFPA